MVKNPSDMTREEFLMKSRKYYNRYGSKLWISSKYYCNVSQETHNQVVANPNLTFVDGYYLQHLKNDNKTEEVKKLLSR